MARIIKRTVQRGKPYEVRWSWYDEDGRRRFAQERFHTHAEAKAKKAEIEQQAVDSSITDPSGGRETFKVWAERWFAVHEATVKPTTARGHRKMLDRYVLPAFGHRRVRAISTGDVQDFVLGLQAQGLAPNTIRNRFAAVRQVLAFAAQSKAISSNPATNVRLPTDKTTGRARTEMQFLDESQLSALATAMEYPNDLLLLFMAYTGLRVGEVAGLRVGDLDLMRKQVTVRRTLQRVGGGWEEHVPKSGKVRRVPIPGWLAEDLRGYLTRHPHNDKPEAPLWPARQNGGAERFAGAKGSFTFEEPWSPGPFRRAFKLALEQAGLPKTVRLHDLRHTYVSLCASAGVPLYRIAQYAGHAHEGITRAIYLHLFDGDAVADMELLTRPSKSEGRVRALA